MACCSSVCTPHHCRLSVQCGALGTTGASSHRTGSSTVLAPCRAQLLVHAALPLMTPVTAERYSSMC
eukprot:16839-Heterococcus_DN1.PRE.1